MLVLMYIFVCVCGCVCAIDEKNLKFSLFYSRLRTFYELIAFTAYKIYNLPFKSLFK